MTSRLFKTIVAGLLVFGVVGVWSVAAPQRADAGPSTTCDGFYGRSCGRGYFKNNYAGGGADVLEGGMPGIGNGQKDAFIERVLWHLNSGDPQRVSAAQFIILTMIGNNSGVAKSVSQAQIDDWKARIQAGNIVLAATRAVFQCGISNAYWQRNYDDVGSLNSNRAEGCGRVNDMIDFYDTNQGGALVYRIRVACANPLGVLDGLPETQKPTPAPSPTPAPTPSPPPPVPPTRPYFQAAGGDVMAGASLATEGRPCSASPHIGTAGIVGWNRRGTPNFGGAGGQYGAFARGYVQDFVTRQGGSSPNPLTFSNKPFDQPFTAANGLYGGQFGNEVSQCIDYWANRPERPSPVPSQNLADWGKGSYYIDGDLTLNASQLPKGKQLTIYVRGNATLTGNITYQAGPYANRGEIPSLRLIVNGVIYIRNNVTALDGSYVAIPDADKADTPNSFSAPLAGTITTCARPEGSYDPSKLLSSSSSYINDCKQPLTVTGSVVAQQVWLLRTGGDLTGAAAEVFRYAPELWLAPPNDTDASTSTDYQSIIGLPPTL